MTLPFLPDWEWQLLTSAGTYLGSLGSATGRSVSWPLDGPATAQCTLVAVHPDALPVSELATDLLVSRLGHALFRGRITASTESHSASGDTLQLTAIDYRGMLDHRIIDPGSTVDFPNYDIAEMAWVLIQENQTLSGDYDLGITQGVGYPSFNVSRTFTAGTTIGSIITQLGNASNGPSAYCFDWEVDVNLKLNIYVPQRGTDHGVSLVYGSNMVSVAKTVNPDAYANKIYYTGGKPTHPITPTALIPSGVGGWDQQHSDPNQTLQLALDDEAGGWLQELGLIWDQTFVVALPAGVWDPTTLWVGDTCHITVDVGRLSISHISKRVDQIDVTLDDNGVETVSLNLGMSPPKLSRRFGQLHRRITGLELEPKTHVLDHQENVSGPSNVWFVVSSYTPPNDIAYNGMFYRGQVHIKVPTGGGNVGVRARFTDSGGAETMTIVPLQAMTAGVWSPSSVQFAATPNFAITLEGYTDNVAVTFSGQIESV